MKSISERLVERLRSELQIPIPEGIKPRRMYHGHHQRSAGAWSWCIGGTTEWLPSYGSSWNMNHILKAEKISIFRENGSDISILPE